MSLSIESPFRGSPDPLATDSSVRSEGWVEAGRAPLSELIARFLRWPQFLWAHRDLLWNAVRHDLQARYRGTLLGFAWVLALPLLQFGIYAFIFTQLLGLKLGPSAAAYPGAMGVYMFTGTLIWSSFADSVQRSTSCILDHRHLVQKLRFPAQLLPLQTGLSSLVTLSAGILAFVLFTGFTSVWQMPGLRLLVWAPVVLLLQFVLTSGIGLTLASLQVRLRDTLPVIGVLLTILMFATPIFWVPSREVLPGIEEWLPLVEMNPIHHLLYVWRDLLMSREPSLAFNGDFGHSLRVVSVWAACFFALGSWMFFRVERHFADEI
ncbi:MAG: lipopolysaccharide transport system permease protein [Planctomycetota bacterium]|jgi:lipopolysaccharide transport system permease protein